MFVVICVDEEVWENVFGFWIRNLMVEKFVERLLSGLVKLFRGFFWWFVYSKCGIIEGVGESVEDLVVEFV